MPYRSLTLLALLLVMAPIPVVAQLPADAGVLPASLRDEALERLNAPATLRLVGDTRVPEGVTIEGDVAVLGGSLELRGTIAGHLLVVNGDLRIASTGRVGADLLLVGGNLRTDEGGEVAGSITTHPLPLRYRTRAGRIEAVPEEGFAPGFLETDLGFGQARFTLRAGPAYNRVEGLPVRFGPLIRTAGSNPLTLEAFGIWRSASGLELGSGQLGYRFLLRQAVGGRGNAFVEASTFREVRANEDRGMADVESSLSTFLLRRDLRDFHEVSGWSVLADLHPARSPLRFRLGFAEEEHGTPLVRDPWTLRSSDRAWRPLAVAGEGTVRSVLGQATWDTTDDPSQPSDGWHFALSVRHQVGGDLVLPPLLTEATDPSGSPPPTALPSFSWGSLDLRRYARVGPTSRLNLRVAASGSLDGDPVPPQYQIALGGEGTLPGHPRFAGDCGARALTVSAPSGVSGSGEAGQPLHAAYGCDRAILFQAEFQGGLPVSWNPVPDEWEDSELSGLFDLQPVWTLFFNAGRGWALGHQWEGLVRSDSPTRADIGAGLHLGPVGLFWAYPLTRRDQGVNFFVRLQSRF